MNNYSKLAWTATPLILVLLCIGLYALFDSSFVRCSDNTEQNSKRCDAIDANMISYVENAEGYSESVNRLANISSNINNLSKSLETQNQEISNLQANIANKEQLVDDLKVRGVYANTNTPVPLNINANINASTTINANAINAEIQRLDIEKAQQANLLKSFQTNVNGLTTEIDKNKKNDLDIRKQYGGRYSNRMIWIFLSALSIMLSIAAAIISGHVIFKCNRFFEEDSEESKDTWSLKIKDEDYSTRTWILITFVIAVASTLIIYIFSDNLMSIELPILSQSILKESINEISKKSLVFFNIAGFFGSIFLISASCKIFETAFSVNRNPETDNEKLKDYAKLLRYLRMILYVGTFMLFVGILRMSFMMKWHLTFISVDPTNESYNLLNNFWASIMTIQGAFYSILLAVIYLPATLWIKEKISQFGKNQNELDAAGVSVKYTDILIRLLAILSPIIATGFGNGKDWLNFFNF